MVVNNNEDMMKKEEGTKFRVNANEMVWDCELGLELDDYVGVFCVLYM
jgi:hypothetical protein